MAQAAARQLTRRRRKVPIPRNAVRRVLSPQPPHAVEMFFVKAVRHAAAEFAKAVGAVLYPRIAEFAKKPPADASDHTDADDDDENPKKDVDALVGDLRAASDKSFDAKAHATSAKTAAKRTLLHSQSEFKRLGLKVKIEPSLKWLIDGWQKDTVDRIKGMKESQLGKVHKILSEGRHHRVETLGKMLERQVKDVTGSRAELLARDQVLTLNAKMTRHRQKAAGIEKFVWSTSQDERVRPEHEELEGEIFDWDEGDPEEGFPGEPDLCRCVAFPILEELEDDDD